MKKLFLIMTVSALLGACAGDDMPKVQLPEIDTNNPLLAEWETPHATPPFDKISISDYEPAFEPAIAVSRAEIDAIVNNPAKAGRIARPHLVGIIQYLGVQHLRRIAGYRNARSA